ncbi:MAG: hypothetical protein K0U98_06525 [Deltaproteobacteria bacterium]|nr:hypothetical protein [Deltaproteobacteria bacterium]
MRIFTPLALAASLLLLVVGGSIPVAAQAIDLSTWNVESKASSATVAFDEAFWELSEDNLSVTQMENPIQTFFYSDFEVAQARVTVELRVDTQDPQDDDYIGFAVGFDPGESQDAAADFLIIDWKQQDQEIFGSTAIRGLAVSRVSGIATFEEYFLHSDNPENPAGGLTELARGATLGNVGWETDRTYVFEVEVLNGSLQVFVDGQLEIDLPGLFDRGRIACFNNSQPLMSCGNITVEPLASPALALDTWNDESYRFGLEAPGSWRLSADALSAEQLNRNDASVFYSDFTLASDLVVAELVTVDNSDDDYMGFVLGFDPGETQNPDAEYLLIDWKKTTQSGQIGGEPFSAEAGLAVSRVFGLPSVAELFGHDDLTSSPVGGVVELARGTNLGGVGWNTGSRYIFTFEVTPASLRVWVEDTTRSDGPRLELDLAGDFSAVNGRFGCFSNSQPRVECANIQRVPLD